MAEAASFALLATRADADRYLAETEEVMLQKGGELYIIDEVYGDYSNSEVIH